jgi:hypothetical protein
MVGIIIIAVCVLDAMPESSVCMMADNAAAVAAFGKVAQEC